MPFPFASARPSRTDAADPAAMPAAAASVAPVETGHADGPQLLSAQELRLVAGGDGEADANRLPVTKW